MKDPQIVIVAFGSQLTDNIARTLRDIGYRSAVLPPDKAELWIKQNRPKAIILSGSQFSVNEPEHPTIKPWIFDVHIPVLGICYGMQVTTEILGGEVVSEHSDRQYGAAKAILRRSELFEGVPAEIDVWTSHGDTVQKVPQGFEVTARSPEGAVAAMENRERRIWGVQFHPEVEHTKHGKLMLGNFVGGIAGCEKDWQPKDMIVELRSRLAALIGPDGVAVMGFSGGVDSTVLAALAAPILGNRLLGVLVDGDQLREGEVPEIKQHAVAAGVRLEIVRAKKKFCAVWRAMARRGRYSSERKRKGFKRFYRSCLSGPARSLKPKRGGKRFFLQGTLAPDMIESGATGGALIKSHHNIGIKLPGCKSVHPLAHLFKHEVRELARLLGLPVSVVYRQPFPGPGLIIRAPVGGYPTEKVTKLDRWADHVVKQICVQRGIYGDMSQLLVAIPNVKVVGVKGDDRVYGYVVWVRGFITSDFMTGTGYKFAPEVWDEIVAALTKHPMIVGAMPDTVSKPPRTCEFE